MKNTKKALSILLAMLLLAGCMVTAFADSGTMGQLTWTYEPATKTLTISGTGNMPDDDLSFPPWRFWNWDTWENEYLFEIEHLIIESGVTSIGADAFRNCGSLKSATIPYSVTSIGNYAFAGCTALADVNYTGSEARWNSIIFGENALPEGVTVNYYYGTLGNISWTYDEATKTMTISGTGDMPEDDSSFPPWRFWNWSTWKNEYLFEIEHLIIESGVTSIGADAFRNCDSLESVTIPDSMTSIGNYAFADCTALTEVNYTGSETQWNNITFGENALPQVVTVNYNYGAAPSQSENLCKWCGKVHEGFFQKIVGFFHRILAAIFGAKF